MIFSECTAMFLNNEFDEKIVFMRFRKVLIKSLCILKHIYWVKDTFKMERKYFYNGLTILV